MMRANSGSYTLHSTGTSLASEINKIKATSDNKTLSFFNLWSKEASAAAANRDYVRAVDAAISRRDNLIGSFRADQKAVYLCLSIIGKGYRNATEEIGKTEFKRMLRNFMRNEMLDEKEVMDICRFYGSGRDLRRMQEMFSKETKIQVQAQPKNQVTEQPKTSNKVRGLDFGYDPYYDGLSPLLKTANRQMVETE